MTYLPLLLWLLFITYLCYSPLQYMTHHFIHLLICLRPPLRVQRAAAGNLVHGTADLPRHHRQRVSIYTGDDGPPEISYTSLLATLSLQRQPRFGVECGDDDPPPQKVAYACSNAASKAL